MRTRLLLVQKATLVGLYTRNPRQNLSAYQSGFWRHAVEEIAYGPIPEGMYLDRIFSIRKEIRVQGDNTINCTARRHQILPTDTRLGFAKAKVEGQRHLNETIHVFYKGEELPFKPIVPQEDE